MKTTPASAADWIAVAPWRSRRLLLLSIEDGAIKEASTLTDKRTLLEHAPGRVLAVWPGGYASSARELTTGDRLAVAAVIA